MTLLAAAVFTLGSLRMPLHPEEETSFAVLFALSVFIFAAFLVFTLDSFAKPGAAVGGAAQRAARFALQGENGDGRHGRFAAARGFPVLFQLRAGEPYVESVVSRARSKLPTSRARS